jgi:hypothetical protein
MRLSEKRVLFTSLICKLIDTVNNDFGLHVALGDVRPTNQSGHMSNSLHYEGLAADLVFYSDEWSYKTKTDEYRILGELWESMHPNCHWGGHFNDGNHFSMSWDDRR